MSNLTEKEDREIKELMRKIKLIEAAMNKLSIYRDDYVTGRMKDGTWVPVIFSGVNPECESPFYSELPDGTISYYDFLADVNTTDHWGTDIKVEGELNEAWVHSQY